MVKLSAGIFVLIAAVLLRCLQGFCESRRSGFNDMDMYSKCSSAPCNRSIDYDPSIDYVFGANDSGCGHPDFNLSCLNDQPILVISGHRYAIFRFRGWYESNFIQLKDAIDVEGANRCSLGNSSVQFRNRDFSLAQNISVITYITNCFGTGAMTLNRTQQYNCSHGKVSYAVIDQQEAALRFGKQHCQSVFQAATKAISDVEDFGTIEINPFGVYWNVADRNWTENCNVCRSNSGLCGYNASESHKPFLCHCKDGFSYPGPCPQESNKSMKYVIIGTVVAVSMAIIATAFFVGICVLKKRSLAVAEQDIEVDCRGFPNQLKLFSYQELEQATDFFDSRRQLGDGGFGTVYRAQLSDGRTVAVKKLHEHNAKRLEQFLNEIKILSTVHHPNLVQLLGYCKDRGNLLLVYEYVSNGTLFDHLHGENGKTRGSLPWDTRLNIAIETAQALAYLHFSIRPPILHRDVKSTNILLDDNMRAKVADFGLSRLVLTEATHVSTAPQGTPGYLDPNYHQHFHLTEKSDVYSFGVVLVELISGLKAVDPTRNSGEIGLASVAVLRIQSGEVHRLVDPRIGFESDEGVRAMVRGVAEVAFLCLSAEKDDRPCMMEVLTQLHRIKQRGYGCADCRSGSASKDCAFAPGLRPQQSPDTWRISEGTPPERSM